MRHDLRTICQFTIFNLREMKARENNVKIGGKKGIGLKFMKVGK